MPLQFFASYSLLRIWPSVTGRFRFFPNWRRRWARWRCTAAHARRAAIRGRTSSPNHRTKSRRLSPAGSANTSGPAAPNDPIPVVRRDTSIG